MALGYPLYGSEPKSGTFAFGLGAKERFEGSMGNRGVHTTAGVSHLDAAKVALVRKGLVTLWIQFHILSRDVEIAPRGLQSVSGVDG